MKVPQVDYFSFGERLAVIEDSNSNTEGMITPYNMLADLIDSDLQNLKDVLPPDSWKTASQDEPFKKAVPTSKDYLYDVYISYSHDPHITSWLRELFLPVLQINLTFEFPRQVNVFMDFQELRLGETFRAELAEAINRSRICIALLTPRYFTSEWCLIEFESFLRRSRLSGVKNALVLPVKLSGGDHFPSIVRHIQMVDFSEFFISSPSFRSSAKYLDFELATRDLARQASRMIEKAPPFDSNWQTVSRSELEKYPQLGEIPRMST
jgi:hypothetical protein